MHKKTFILICCLLATVFSHSQNALKHFTDAVETRYSSKQPVIHYILSVDTADLSSFQVEMHVRNVPDNFQLAMVTHPEYDDRFWRFVKDLRIQTAAGNGAIAREDSALWRVIKKGEECVVNYRIQLPATNLQNQRPSWTPFLSSTGGLVGGPHSFMYIVGHTLAPSHVTIKVPDGWEIASGLQSTSDATTFFAPSVFILTDCPVLVGKFKKWLFAVDGVPHHVIYWPLPNAKSFDEVKLVSSVEKMVRQTALFFGRLPYREYIFLLQDNAWGALEHSNSVTVGIPASRFEEYYKDYMGEIAHEYFHSWNLVRIHPVEYGDVGYKKQPLSKGLWFSEGFTMFYADLLLRRAGIPTVDSTRIQHLERLVRRYYSSPGAQKFSPEKVSMASYGPEDMLGDYMASAHLQGELLGTMLDLLIRDATKGTRSMDDVMDIMMERFSGETGFDGKDIEQAIKDVSGIDVHTFFETYVRGNRPFDLEKYLRLAGLEYTLAWTEAMDREGKPVADFRLFSFMAANESKIRLRVTDPEGCWGKAGLHTNDILISVNEKPINNPSEFSQIIRSAKMGDIIVIEVQRPSGRFKTNVQVTGYKQAVVHVNQIKGITERQKRLYEQWLGVNDML